MSCNSAGLAPFINRRLFLITLICTLCASVFSAIFTLSEFNQILKPKLLQKINAVIYNVEADIELALNVGIALPEIRGLEDYLQHTVDQYPELLYISIADKHRNLLHQNSGSSHLNIEQIQSFKTFDSAKSTVTSLWLEKALYAVQELAYLMPLNHTGQEDIEHYRFALTLDNQSYGEIRFGLDPDYIRTQLSEVFFDIAIVLIAVLLVSFELVLVLVMFYLSAPLQRAEDKLERQALGDFSVDQDLHAKSEIDHYSRQLNNDSLSLQERYQRLVKNVNQQEVKQQLHELATRFNLIKVFQQQQGNVLDARIPLFVFSFAEELQKSFMPLFVADYYQASSWLSKDVILALPISIFMLVIAITTPFAGVWVDRWGNKRLFLIGLIPALAGHLGCAFADSSWDIIGWRSVTALGYAIITISCQGYIAAAVPAENRAKGMAIFVGVLMTATMSGTALGGIIADRIGYHSVFLLSAFLTGVAGLLAWRMLSTDQISASQKAAKTGKKAVVTLFKNRQFFCLVVLCAIPAKIILTGFLYYFVPVYLISLDASQSEIGRIMMVYALVIIPLSPIASRFADRSGKMLELIVLGTLLSGSILFALYFSTSVWSVLLATGAMGVAHSILKAPLIATALMIGQDKANVGRTTVLGVLRTSERIGSVLGPMIVAGFLLTFNYTQAMAIIGAFVILSGLVLAYFFLYMRQSEGETQ